MVYPFAWFEGAVPRFVVAAASVPAFQIPNMTQILPANPRRVAIYFRSEVGGVALTTLANGIGVPVRQCLFIDPAAGGDFNAQLETGDPEGLITDAWFACTINGPAPGTAVLLFTGFEILQQ